MTGVNASREGSADWILSVRFEVHPGLGGEALMRRWSLSAVGQDGEPLTDHGHRFVRTGDDASAAVGRWLFSSPSESAPTKVVLRSESDGESEAQQIEMPVRLAADGEDLDEETGAPEQDGGASLRVMASRAFEVFRAGFGHDPPPTFEPPTIAVWTDEHELLARDLIGSLGWTRDETEEFLRRNQGGSMGPTEAAMESIQEGWIDTSWPECLRHGQHPMTLRAEGTVATGYPLAESDPDHAHMWWACPHTGELLCRRGRLGVDHPYPPRPSSQ